VLSADELRNELLRIYGWVARARDSLGELLEHDELGELHDDELELLRLDELYERTNEVTSTLREVLGWSDD
jgi:hypothetical protein